MAGIKIENFYDHVSKKNKSEPSVDYPNKKEIQINVPCRALVCGKSGDGKTNTLLNLIKNINAWQRYYLFAKNLHEPLYAEFIENIKTVEKKCGFQILFYSDNLNDLPPIKDFDENKKSTLFIFDDQVCEKGHAVKIMEEIWIRGRKDFLSTIYITQSYFDMPKLMRKNTDYVFFKKLNTTRDLTMTLKEYQKDDIPLKFEKELYNLSLIGSFTNFFMIDCNNNNPNMIYRKNFTGIPWKELWNRLTPEQQKKYKDKK